MYGAANAQEETKAHLGGLTEQSYLQMKPEDNSPYGRIARRIHDLADRFSITKEEAANAIKALKAWMAAMPEDVDALTHAEQFYAEYEGTQFSYLPEPYPQLAAIPPAEEDGDDQERKFDAKRHFVRNGWDPTDLDLSLEEYAAKYKVPLDRLEDLREFEV